MGYIEFTGKTVNDAIMKASLNLTTSSEDLDIKVISEGSSGFFGIGSKPAIIKACRKSELEEEKTEVVSAIQPEVEELVEEIKKTATKEVKETAVEEVSYEEVENTAVDFLKTVFKAMEMEVVITATYNAAEKSLDIDFAGEDMGILIGKRGQTLDSLQYLTNLVVNKEHQQYVRVKLDTENYRKRRRETLENLSRNIAYKVKKTRRPVSLEPMNPYERRIIHSALQGNKFVETYSEGKEPYRHVVIALKSR